MRGHGVHMWLCAVMIAGVGLIALISGSALALVPVVGCVVMMAAMMLMMGGTGDGSP